MQKAEKERPFPKKKRKRQQKCSGYCENCISDDCYSQDSELLDSQRGKQARGNPMQKVLGPNRRMRFTQPTLRQASIWKKPSLGKYKSKILISEVLTQRNLRTGPKKRLKDTSDAPEARHGTLPKTYTSAKKRTRLHSTRPRKNGSRLRQQKSRRKESLW